METRQNTIYFNQNCISLEQGNLFRIWNKKSSSPPKLVPIDIRMKVLAKWWKYSLRIPFIFHRIRTFDIRISNLVYCTVSDKFPSKRQGGRQHGNVHFRRRGFPDFHDDLLRETCRLTCHSTTLHSYIKRDYMENLYYNADWGVAKSELSL